MKTIEHKFVEFVPNIIEEGVLYITIKYKTAVHLCICGCGNKVITPITPTDWQIIFDGKTVSLSPSIGNWSFECRSHYWIKRNQIRLARKWNDWEIIESRTESTKKQSFKKSKRNK
jgi:hypothetical protein